MVCSANLTKPTKRWLGGIGQVAQIYAYINQSKSLTWSTCHAIRVSEWYQTNLVLIPVSQELEMTLCTYNPKGPSVIVDMSLYLLGGVWGNIVN